MNTHLRIDRESFQKLLASAYSVQESGVESQSLAALLELQRSIAKGELDLDRALYLVAEHARRVADASGIAIALRRGDQLVYRAGSGCADRYVGRHMTAILSVSARNEVRGEILRVENALTDARIEAAICRQFESQSLLILPIYEERAVAGVLAVLFSEAHAFEDREMRAYRLMTGLVEEAMCRDARLGREKALATHAAAEPHAFENTTSQMPSVLIRDDNLTPRPARKHGVDLLRSAATVVARLLANDCMLAKAATVIAQHVKHVAVHRRRWNVTMTGVVTAVVIAACWVVYYRLPASPGDKTPLKSNALQQQTRFVPTKPAPNLASKALANAEGKEGERAPSRAFKRVRFGTNEVDYVADDVTIRYFRTESARPRERGGYKEARIGEDVTVRYFASVSTTGGR